MVNSARDGFAHGFAVVILFCGACDRHQAADPAKPGSDQPSVLLITLDTTRADRLGCYGYEKARTPTLDALAHAGVRFDQAFCQVPLTLPSHASLFTGTYPPTTGLRINGGGVLPQDLPTMAELFKSHGYRTGAFIGSWVVNSTFGLNRGFDHYDEDFPGRSDDWLLNPERTGDVVCDAAVAWLDQQPRTPFFAWVHFFDPHSPYAPPPEFQGDPADPYDGEIAFTDSQVGRLLEWLDTRGLRQRTLIVIAGDHGEAFEEHGEIEHGFFLYDPTMRVPLILSYPSCLPNGKVVAAGVRLIDVFPTIVDLMGWDPLPSPAGKSLRSAWASDGFDSLPAYGETQYPRLGFGWAALQSYTTQPWKYIKAPRPELYDRIGDPAELVNVIDDHPDVAGRLDSALTGLLAAMPQRDAATAPLDGKTIRALESLGYVGVGASAADSGASQTRRDPKDMLPVFRAMCKATSLVQQHRFADVVRLLEPLAAQSPESDELHALLGEAYVKLGRFKEAESACRASLRTIATNPRKWSRLGDALLGQNKVDEALQSYQQALVVDADYGTVHNRLGAIYLRKKQIAKAHEHFHRHLELKPDSPNVLTNLANVLPQMGRHEEAVKLLRRALEIDPNHAASHRFLWQVLLTTGQRVEAISALRSATKVLPEDTALKRHLAGLLATTPQAGPTAKNEAVQLARECCDADADNPENFGVLAVAYAATGNFPKAIEATRRAGSLARAQGKTELVNMFAIQLQAYEQGRTR